ncbi:MAG: hypothetical protein ABIQ39_11600 [Ilumatobacteraceae bacterium]
MTGGSWALWTSRVLWAAVGISGWSALDTALNGRGAAARLAVGVAAWIVFGIVVVALVVPSTVSLTVVRMTAPLALVAAIVSWVSGSGAARGAAFVAAAAVNAVVILGGDVGEIFAQASAYGDEHRFPLRPPVPYVVPVVLSWCVWAAATVGGVLLAATEWWFVGVAVLIVAAVLTWLLLPRYHRLSRRWLVVVPAGLVIHDHLVLAETLLVKRAELASLGLALAQTEAADLTGPASGHAIDVAVRETVKVAFATTRAKTEGRAIHARSFLVAPTRPGRALKCAADSRLPGR